MTNVEDISIHTAKTRHVNNIRLSGPAFHRKPTNTTPYDPHLAVIDSIKSSESELMDNFQVEENKYDYLMNLGKIQLIRKD